MDKTLDRIEDQIKEIDRKVDSILVSDAALLKDVAQNTKDLAFHIKRTNQLESRVQKVYYLLLLGAGFGLAESWPMLKSVLGALL